MSTARANPVYDKLVIVAAFPATSHRSYSRDGAIICSLWGIIADSGHRDQPIRLIVITQTGDRDHAAHQGRGGAWRAAWGGIGRHH